MKKKQQETIGDKFNRLFTHVMLVISATCALIAVYYFIKAAME